MGDLTIECREYNGEPLPAPPEQRLWNDPSFLPARGATMALYARRGGRLAGFWLVPLDAAGAARRPLRLFPYCAPWIDAADNLQRRRVFGAMVTALQDRVDLVDLPLAPGFLDANAAVAQGCFAEWRHTHILTRTRWAELGERAFTAKAAAHAGRAERHCTVGTVRDFSEFCFERAIVGPPAAVQQRIVLARALWDAGQAFAMIARDGSRQLGGAFIACDGASTYLYHLWSDRAQSGVSPLLVREALRRTFRDTPAESFDFEGSILAGVDEFMSSFGGDITPYPHLYWARDENDLASLLRESLHVPGRVRRPERDP